MGKNLVRCFAFPLSGMRQVIPVTQTVMVSEMGCVPSDRLYFCNTGQGRGSGVIFYRVDISITKRYLTSPASIRS